MRKGDPFVLGLAMVRRVCLGNVSYVMFIAKNQVVKHMDVKRALVISQTLLMEMVERILLLQLESEIYIGSSESIFPFDIQRYVPARVERSSGCQLCRKHYNLWNCVK